MVSVSQISYPVQIAGAHDMPIGIILGLKNVNMSYEHYDHNIVSHHMVKLNGWPASLQRISPSKINTVEEIRSLRDALKAGDCMWSKLSPCQHTAHLESLEARIAADPSLAKPTRKARSDKGIRKKKAASGSKGKHAEVGVVSMRNLSQWVVSGKKLLLENALQYVAMACIVSYLS